MLTETVFRSEDLPVADRFDAWRECMSRTHAPLDFRSDAAADFHAHSRLIGLGAVSVWPSTFQQLIWLRTPKLVRQSDPETFHLTLLRHGAGGVNWGRQENSYRPEDFHTNDSSRPYQIWSGPELTTIIGVEVPKTLLPIPRDKVDRVIGQPMSAHEGIGKLLAQFLTQIAADTSCYQPTDGPRLGTVLVDLMAALFAHTLEADACLPPETRTQALTLRIKAFIQQHLGDPELTPGQIAAAHHISPSYLHRLFQQTGAETVAAHIRGQRLEGAHRDLADPTQRATPVNLIAARWGFTSAAGFTRAFHRAYGTAPTDHRHDASRAQAGR